MNVVRDPATQLLIRLQRLLRWRLWVQEKLQLSEWQVTLLWAALAGFLGSLSSLIFAALAEGVHEVLTGSSAGVVAQEKTEDVKLSLCLDEGHQARD